MIKNKIDKKEVEDFKSKLIDGFVKGGTPREFFEDKVYSEEDEKRSAEAFRRMREKIFPESINEYQKYIKTVTDNFIEMQTDKADINIGHDADKFCRRVVLKEDLNWEFDLDCNSYIKGTYIDEIKKYNAEIALEYLSKNMLTYENWMLKYKKQITMKLEFKKRSGKFTSEQISFKTVDNILKVEILESNVFDFGEEPKTMFYEISKEEAGELLDKLSEWLKS